METHQKSHESNDTSMPKVAPVGDSKSTPTAKQRKKKSPKKPLIVLAIIGLAGLAGFGGAWAQEAMEDEQFAFQSAANDGNMQVTEDEQDITQAVNKISKSVVSVVTEVTSRSYLGTQVGEGAGTGVIISSNGYILTNKHVIDGTSDISIVMSNGTTYDDVSIVGTDPLNDIAFLKIANVDDLPAAEIGDSGSTRIAQEVLAIGNSLGQYQNTVTRGIISGKGRPVVAESSEGYETLTDLIQTDAAINPGNSGGPLVNTSGQVIGINTAMAAEAQGIGFAIPINATKGMMKGLLKDGKAQRAFLGINYLSITPEVAKEFKLDVNAGAFVRGSETSRPVVAGSPADDAGIKEGDIILKVNDDVVGENGGMGNLIAEYAPGETVKLTYLRDGKRQTVDVTLENYRT